MSRDRFLREHNGQQQPNNRRNNRVGDRKGERKPNLLVRDRLRGDPSHRRAPKLEKELMVRGKGTLVPGSGSGAEKADVRKYSGIFRIEAKTTKKESFRVTREMVSKLQDVAMAHGELPAFVIEFIDDRGRPLHKLAVLMLDDLDDLIQG